jgi:hypothetical protein
VRIPKSRAWYFEAVCIRTKAHYVEMRGEASAEQRAADIAALPSKDWKGSRVFEVECEGSFGKGPHKQFVPEYVLWNQIALEHFLCPFHR